MKKLFFYIILFFCITLKLSGRDINEIKKSGKLYAAFSQSELSGINFLLANEFARFLDVELVVVSTTWQEISSSLNIEMKSNAKISEYDTPEILTKSDFIGSSLYLDERLKAVYQFAGLIDMVNLLVYNSEHKKISSYNDLKGSNITYVKNKILKKDLLYFNSNIWGDVSIEATASEKQSLDLLHRGTADAMITSGYHALELIKDKKYKIAFPVSEIRKAGWAVDKNNSGLAREINNFFELILGNGRFEELISKVYGHKFKSYFQSMPGMAQLQTKEIIERDLDEILESGKLKVALRDRLMVYNSQKKQFNHYIAEEFAKYLGVELEFVLTPYFSKYFESDKGYIIKDSTYTPQWFNEFDIASEIIVPLEWRTKKIDVIPFVSYAQVVIGRKDAEISSINDLKKHKGVTSKGSAQEDILINHNVRNYYYASGNRFLSDVNSGKADYTIGTDALFRISGFEELEAKFVIDRVDKFGWAIKRNQPKLKQKILEFLNYAEDTGILDKYFRLQTGMSLKETENYLKVLQETYQPGVFPFVFYGTKEGLPQEDILSMYQDNKRYMWFGTHSGLVKYNGREMKVYTKAEGLSNNSIFDIAQDKNNIIFFATLKGISYYQNQEFKTLFENHSFRGVYIDNNDNKWFYGEEGLGYLDDNGEKKWLNDEIKDFPTNINAVSGDKGGEIYIATKDGIFILNKSWELEKLSNENTYHIFSDDKNGMWISSERGLFLKKTNQQGVGTKIDKELNLPENEIIKKIWLSQDGTVWLISDSKIFQLITLQQKPIVFDDNIGLKPQRILSFLQDEEKNIWIGYSGGIHKLTNKSLRLLYPDKLNSYVNSLSEDVTGRIWLGVNQNIYVLKDKLSNLPDLEDLKGKSFLAQNLSDENVVVANTNGLYKIEPGNLTVLDKNLFETPIQYLEKIFVSSNDEIFLLTGLNGVVYYFKDFNSNPLVISDVNTNMIHHLAEYKNRVIGGNNTNLVQFNGSNFKVIEDIGDIVWTLCSQQNKLWIGTESGLGVYKNGKYEKRYIDIPNPVINAICVDSKKSYLWLGTNEGFVYYNTEKNKVELSVDAKDGLQGNEIAIDGLYLDDKGLLWVGSYHGVSTFDIQQKKILKYAPEVVIEEIWLNGADVEVEKLSNGLKHYENNLVFDLAGLSFSDEESVEYEYFIKGLRNDYTASRGKQFKAQYTNLPPGKYEFKYRAKGNDGVWSYYKSLKFEILKPFYDQWWFKISAVLLVLLGFYGFIRWRNHTLRKRNAELEEIVEQRTAEITKKNSMLQEQNEEIKVQRDQIDEQHTAITDSIYYAQRIQTAVMPRKEYIDSILPENFILFRPRDIVSGDFYWAKQLGKYIVITAADCTGHGVPGSIMSMLGISFINEIVQKREILEAHIILNELRQMIKQALRQTSKEDEVFDGMDMALCVINTEDLTMQYAGAANPLYYVQDDEFKIIKADRMAIGYYPKEKPSFTNHTLQLKKGDVFYLFSDGIIDQFGGEHGDKFKAKTFRDLLFSIHDKSMTEQKELLENALDKWKGDFEQTDDIIVLGVRV